MTWDEVIEEMRNGLRESGAHLRTCTKLLTVALGDNTLPDQEAVLVSLVTLSMAVSNLHDVVSGLGLGVEAIVETLREATDAQDKP